MKESLPSRRSSCPIACALDCVGDKWTLIVLRDIIMLRKHHFQELLQGSEGIASNILASRLKLLEAAGMITRRRDPAQARRVIYEPTAKALDLLPVIVELARWGMKHDPGAAAPAHFLRRLAKDREGFIASIRAAHDHGGQSRQARRLPNSRHPAPPHGREDRNSKQ
jgi:DNA-binding HxlR family transcriptional regulator